MNGIYLAAYNANHPDFNIIYQDINGKRDLAGDMMDINLDNYDLLLHLHHVITGLGLGEIDYLNIQLILCIYCLIF